MAYPSIETIWDGFKAWYQLTSKAQGKWLVYDSYSYDNSFGNLDEAIFIYDTKDQAEKCIVNILSDAYHSDHPLEVISPDLETKEWMVNVEIL